MKKIGFKRLVLGTLMALQLTNGTGATLSTAYAKEIPNNEILVEESGKELHMIGIIIDDYESITVGYIYSKDGCVYVKDAIDGRIYNFTNISESLNTQEYPEIVFTEIENVLPDDLKDATKLTREEATNLIQRFSLTDFTFGMPGIGVDDYDVTIQSFAAPGIDTEKLHVVNSSKFDDAAEIVYSFTVTDNYNPEEEIIDLAVNNFRLGILDTATTHPVYSDIYSKTPICTSDKMGVIIRYYVFDKSGKRIATLNTQKEIDAFVEDHEKDIYEFKWKAAYYTGPSVDNVLNLISQNKPVSYEATSYFTDYKPAMKKLTNNQK